MSCLLKRVQVKNLYGSQKCIDAQINNNTLILVGENGSGKTTFLRILYNILAGRWRSLSLFNFSSAILTFDDEDIEITHSTIDKHRKRNTNRLQSLPSGAKQAILEALDLELPQKESLQAISDKYRIPVRFLIDQCNSFDDDPDLFSHDARNKLKKITEKVNAQVLYLPTYRRIERELASVVDWIDPSDLNRNRVRSRFAQLERTNSYVELVEFGMQDVEESKRAELDRLEKFQSESLNILYPFRGRDRQKSHEATESSAG
jgi:hypothetical protein